MTEYLLAGAAAIALATGGYAYMADQRSEALRVQVAQTQGELMTCGARLNNLLEDIQSDNQIDNLPDSALRTVPDHWLRP